MSVKAKLDALREAYPHCQVVAFADVDTGTVLTVSGFRSYKHEEMEWLCSTAVDCLEGPDRDRSTTGVDRAIVASTRDIRVFLRSKSDPADTLLCLCDPEIDLGSFTLEATRVLTAIGEET
ncbi:MAG: hypothetical protein AAFN59_08190 [Pseudomonadota bacterium]